MGTDFESVLEDIEALKEHLKYFAECKGRLSLGIESDIDVFIDQLRNLAKDIDR